LTCTWSDAYIRTALSLLDHLRRGVAMAIAEVAAAVPWPFVALVALLSALFAFTVLAVRSAKTNMIVRFGKIEIRRGTPDPGSRAGVAPGPRLRSVDPLPHDLDPPAVLDEGQPNATIQ
jgi:hypothetical protein